MKALIVYWIIGCIILGGAQGKLFTECPNDPYKIDSSDLVAIALWPAILMAAYEARGANFPKHSCKQEASIP